MTSCGPVYTIYGGAARLSPVVAVLNTCRARRRTRRQQAHLAVIIMMDVVLSPVTPCSSLATCARVYKTPPARHRRRYSCCRQSATKAIIVRNSPRLPLTRRTAARWRQFYQIHISFRGRIYNSPYSIIAVNQSTMVQLHQVG